MYFPLIERVSEFLSTIISACYQGMYLECALSVCLKALLSHFFGHATDWYSAFFCSIFQNTLLALPEFVENERIGWVLKNQKSLRAELYQGIVDHNVDDGGDGRPLGRSLDRPSSVALATCKRTTKMQWPMLESTMVLISSSQ